MKLNHLSLLLSATVVVTVLSGCTEQRDPSDIVVKKCEHLKALSEHDQDLDQGSQPLARDSIQTLCEDALHDCGHAPNGKECKKALEKLSAVP